MAKYKIPDSVYQERDKAIVLSLVDYYTQMNGYIDLEKINPTTLSTKFGINPERAKKSTKGSYRRR
ncbi:MAG: hypothetical protein ACTSUF_03630 [Candidatus Heimdallarchaeaceae archaeon]